MTLGDSRSAALSLPAGRPGDGTWPLVVMFAGGFWRQADTSSLAAASEALNAAGYATFVPVPVTLDDAVYPELFEAAAEVMDHIEVLAEEHPVSPDRVVALGHGSGATLALWCAARGGLAEGEPGSDPAVSPRLVVSIEGVTNLAAAAIELVGGDAVETLMGSGPAGDNGSGYGQASPIESLPLGVPALLVHQADDAIVPAVFSETFADRARDAGDDVTLEVLEGGHHYTPLEPRSEGWKAVMSWLDDRT